MTRHVPWQVTGNHWVTLPCIHPADAAIHCVGGVHARSRAAVEFAGAPEFLGGGAAPLARVTLDVGGVRSLLGAEGIAWERDSGWMPSFSCRLGDLALRGVICAPHGKNADVAGAVIAISLENRGSIPLALRLGLEGSLGHRQMRVRSPRAFSGAHVARDAGGFVVMEGAGAESPMAVAVGGEGHFELAVEGRAAWSLAGGVTLEPGQSQDCAFHIAVGADSDGAAATLRVMRRRGAPALVSATRAALREMEPASGNSAADRLIARHAFFCYFGCVARALDESHWYVVRSRVPWNERGLTIRDWEALMWILPAVLLVDQGLARELLLRICELHGHSPGAGVHYLDGSVFEPGFSLEGASAYAVAVDSYIVQSSDDRIVEEPVLADSLYGSHEDIEARRHPQYPLYSTEVNPDGTLPDHPYTAHGNAVAALALDILRHTLDEKTAEKLEDPAAVRAALMRHFGDGQSRPSLQACIDLAGNASATDIPGASLHWLPSYDLISRDDSVYRRTVKRLGGSNSDNLEVRCAQLLGPAGAEAFDWLRRAPLDGGLAAESVDEEGRATAGGGDAALSGLIAHTAWYAVHALGLKG